MIDMEITDDAGMFTVQVTLAAIPNIGDTVYVPNRAGPHTVQDRVFIIGRHHGVQYRVVVRPL